MYLSRLGRAALQLELEAPGIGHFQHDHGGENGRASFSPETSFCTQNFQSEKPVGGNGVAKADHSRSSPRGFGVSSSFVKGTLSWLGRVPPIFPVLSSLLGFPGLEAFTGLIRLGLVPMEKWSVVNSAEDRDRGNLYFVLKNLKHLIVYLLWSLVLIFHCCRQLTRAFITEGLFQRNCHTLIWRNQKLVGSS